MAIFCWTLICFFNWFYGGLRLFSDVWSGNAALFERLMEIHSNPPIDLMHWRHVSITTTPCWGSRLVALRARVVLAERILALSLCSQCAGPGQPGGMACRGWPSGCMLGDGARGSATFDPQRAWAPFCDVICIRSILYYGFNDWFNIPW